jgi:purine-binding chemotaxis protein CheW
MNQTHLIFCHHGARYGIDVAFVREIVWLPELAPVEELPPAVVGMFNLRGQLVPVIDLGLRFGHPRQPFLVSDRVIVIERDRALLGIVAGEIDDVLAIAPQAIDEADGCRADGQDGGARLVRAEARLEQGLAMLLDVDALLCIAPLPAAPAPAQADGGRGFGSLSADDLETVRRRALALAQVVQGQNRDGLQAFAVIKLGGELFGLDLDAVCGFSPLRAVAPLPCCPPHVVGNMNLRGEILTLVDIGPALGMALDGAALDCAAPGGAMRKVVVLRTANLLLGLPAQEIVDVVHLAQSEIAPLPLASSLYDAACCKGVATVDGHAVALLDLHKVLAALQPRAPCLATTLTDRKE